MTQINLPAKNIEKKKPKVRKGQNELVFGKLFIAICSESVETVVIWKGVNKKFIAINGPKTTNE